MTAIAKGSFVKGNVWQYTFLCSRCTSNTNLSFPAGATSAGMAMAVSDFSPIPVTSSSAQLLFHSKGYANFDTSEMVKLLCVITATK
jgi:Cytochrome domain of cellobiose dehydrogenase